MRIRLQLSSAYFVRAGAIVIAAVAVPAVGSSQQALPPVQIEVSRNAAQNALADELEVAALRLHSTPRRFFEAGQLHRRAALLRGSNW